MVHSTKPKTFISATLTLGLSKKWKFLLRWQPNIERYRQSRQKLHLCTKQPTELYLRLSERSVDLIKTSHFLYYQIVSVYGSRHFCSYRSASYRSHHKISIFRLYLLSEYIFVSLLTISTLYGIYIYIYICNMHIQPLYTFFKSSGECIFGRQRINSVSTGDLHNFCVLCVYISAPLLRIHQSYGLRQFTSSFKVFVHHVLS